MRMPMKWRDDDRELKNQMTRLLELLSGLLKQSCEESSEGWRAFNLSNVSQQGRLFQGSQDKTAVPLPPCREDSPHSPGGTPSTPCR
jgi:hypothetical protein